MKPLSDLELVALAARCDSGPALDAALQALALAWPATPPARWPALDAGRRDALLLELRRTLFGERLQAESACPACGERLEFELGASVLAGARVPLAPAEELPPLAVQVGTVTHRWRRPGSDDLLAAADAAALMRRCRLDDSAVPDASCEDPAWQQAFGDALAADDACVDPQVALVCPACHAAWEEAFDIAHFLADDLRAAGRRLLDEVHVMALGYHWSEREILELPAARRHHYLRRLTE
jgi:hypothetical protein